MRNLVRLHRSCCCLFLIGLLIRVHRVGAAKSGGQAFSAKYLRAGGDVCRRAGGQSAVERAS
jgi:hypothetical protein